jgi:hypothetical protein
LPLRVKNAKEIKSEYYFYEEKAEPITALPLIYLPL